MSFILDQNIQNSYLKLKITKRFHPFYFQIWHHIYPYLIYLLKLCSIYGSWPTSVTDLLLYNSINKNMQRGNSSEIKIYKKASFRPIMLTSKSIKPIQRSKDQKTKINKQTSRIIVNEHPHIRKRHSQHYAIHSDSFNRSEIIKKLTEQYRLELLKDVNDELHSPKRNHPFTTSIIQVEFGQDQAKERQSARAGFQGSILPSTDQSNLPYGRYSISTANKAYETYISLSKNRMNHSLYGHNLVRAHSSKHSDEWAKCLDKHYLNVKKIHPSIRHEMAENKLPGDKLTEINQKVEQYQNNLIRKMHQRFKVASSFLDDMEIGRANSPDKKSPDKTGTKNCRQKIQQDLITKRQSNRKEYFVFGLSDLPKGNPELGLKQRFDSYKDFLWKINYSNAIYVILKDEIDTPYKFHVGPGNNSMLIKGIMRRRFWWQVVEKPTQEANFVWTQIKVNEYFKYQKQGKNKAHSFLRHRKIHSALQKSTKSEADSDQKCKKQGHAHLDAEEDPNSKIFTGKDKQIWRNHFELYRKFEQKQQKYEQCLSKRIKTMIRRKELVLYEQNKYLKIQNHFQSNFFLGNKKALFYSLRKYYNLLNRDPFQHIPLTFHISKGMQDPEYNKFIEKYNEFQQKKKNKQSQNIWIVKPGEMTNRGRGITVCSILDDVKVRLKSKQRAKNGQLHTYIVQKYIEKPLLYNKRKFDIRHYMLMTCVNGKFKGYWYQQGYLRTTSYEYNVKNCKDLYTHLTNDAIQKYSADYGKFEKGNKLSYADFQKYLNTNYRSKQKNPPEVDRYDFFGHVLPKMKQLATDAMRATYMLLSPRRYEHNFQLFGLDFMLDEEMNVYLIEVNTNPCLQTSCPLLSKLIPAVVENVFKICVDPLFPPPYEWPAQRRMPMGDNSLEENRFVIVFDENQQGQQLAKLMEKGQKQDDKMGEIDEEDEVYEDEGKQWVQD